MRDGSATQFGPKNFHVATTMMARLMFEDGWGYRAAQQQASMALGLPLHWRWPDEEEVEVAIASHIQLFCAQSQAQHLFLLRSVALRWMRAFSALRPFLSGSVWRGIAHPHASIDICCFVDEVKLAEIALLNAGCCYGSVDPRLGRIHTAYTSTLICQHPLADKPSTVNIHFYIHDYDEIKGALRRDKHGKPWLGDIRALSALIEVGEYESR